MSIPRRLIQIWGSTAPGGRSFDVPPLAKAAAMNLKLLHPDWEYLFFDDRAVSRFIASEFPQYQHVFDSFRHPIQRFDFFRYLAIFRLGGFYFDLDVFLSEPITDLLYYEAVFPFEELTLNRFLREQHSFDWEIGNYAFGASSANAFVGSVIENCIRAQRDHSWLRPMMQGIPAFFRSDFYVFNTTGPGLVSRTMAEDRAGSEKVKVLFPDNVCDPSSWHHFGHYGVHLMSGSWRHKGSFLRSRFARAWEYWSRHRLLAESIRLGPKRRTGAARIELS